MSIEKQLKELDRLKTKGVITEGEYQTRRSAVIASGDVPRQGGLAGGIFKWGAAGCLVVLGGFALLGILGVIIIALAISSGGDSDELQDGRAPLTVGSSATAQTAGGAKVKITIDAISDPASPGTVFQPPRDGHHFLTVTVTVENVAEREVEAGGAAILRITDGTEYTPTFFFGADAGYLKPFQKLTSGGRTSGAVAFEVADGSQIEWLKFDPNQLAKGDIYFDAS